MFDEPWQAQAFAMTISLHQQGVFTWQEWADTLSAVLAGDREGGESYYRHWLEALETLIAEKGLVSAGSVDTRERAWHEAAARTPHGQPIEL